MNLPVDAPFFLPPHKGDPGGVDYLGLRAINLQMMDELLPGLNNVARCIRPFALLSWSIWTYETHSLESRKPMTSSGYQRFREKLETLFVLSHKLAGLSVSGIAGADQAVPASATTTLSFPVLGRSPDTTLIHATTYGPGLKGDYGLRFAFAAPEARGIFRVTRAGERLAVAFDNQLRRTLTPEQYRFLRAPDELEIARGEAAAFAAAWEVGRPTEEEKEAFLARLCPDNDDGPREQARVATLSLIRTVLTRSPEPLTARELRRALAASDPASLPSPLLSARARWQALQLRQAQRLALEAMFGWVERRIWHDNARATDRLCLLMAESLRAARPGWDLDWVIRDRLAHFEALGPDHDALFQRGLSDPECDLVERADRLQDEAAGRVPGDEVLANAFDILVLVAVHTEHFARAPELARYVSDGALQRIPLRWWATTLRSHAAMPFPRFAERLIETWLISQHLGVAASRHSEDSGRMRLSIDDGGICSLLPAADKCWSPVLSADRLETALSLLCESGCLTRFPDADGVIRYAAVQR
jgi:hypothetical protein